MATTRATLDLLLEQLAGLADRLDTRAMFGEYCLYYDGKVVAFVCDDKLFMKITPASRRFLDSSHDAPAYPGSKPYLCVTPDLWDDRDWLERLVQETADSLPAPRPARARRSQAQP